MTPGAAVAVEQRKVVAAKQAEVLATAVPGLEHVELMHCQILVVVFVVVVAAGPRENFGGRLQHRDFVA